MTSRRKRRPHGKPPSAGTTTYAIKRLAEVRALDSGLRLRPRRKPGRGPGGCGRSPHPDLRAPDRASVMRRALLQSRRALTGAPSRWPQRTGWPRRDAVAGERAVNPFGFGYAKKAPAGLAEQEGKDGRQPVPAGGRADRAAVEGPSRQRLQPRVVGEPRLDGRCEPANEGLHGGGIEAAEGAQFGQGGLPAQQQAEVGRLGHAGAGDPAGSASRRGPSRRAGPAAGVGSAGARRPPEARRARRKRSGR